MITPRESWLNQIAYDKELLNLRIKEQEMVRDAVARSLALKQLEAAQHRGDFLSQDEKCRLDLLSKESLFRDRPEQRRALQKRYEQQKFQLLTNQMRCESEAASEEGRLIDIEASINKIRAEIAERDRMLEGVSAEFANLSEMLRDDRWPEAVSPDMMNPDDAMKMQRAVAIMGAFFSDGVKGKSFLDFGCGEGFVARQARFDDAKISVGYDITQQGEFAWEQEEAGLLLTKDWSRVEKYGPYERVLLFDVLDHVAGFKQEEVMRAVRSVCTDDAIVAVRCHPFYAKHGGHLYRTINKAYIHLVFSTDELKQLGCTYDMEHFRHPFDPVIYLSFFEDGFKLLQRSEDREDYDTFFNQPLFPNRFKGNLFGDCYRPELLSINAVDFILKSK